MEIPWKEHLACSSLLTRTAVQLAGSLGVSADVAQGGYVASVLVDTNHLTAAVSRHTRDSDSPLALVTLGKRSANQISYQSIRAFHEAEVGDTYSAASSVDLAIVPCIKV